MPDFDSIPRSPKRRRTGTYTKSRTTLTSGTQEGNITVEGIRKAGDGKENRAMSPQDPENSTIEQSESEEGVQREVEAGPNGGSIEQESETRDDDESARSSRRTRRPPKRFSASPESKRRSSQVKTTQPARIERLQQRKKPNPPMTAASVTRSPQPKGILTPSRREKRTGPRKSVVFDEDEHSVEQQLGFKDIDTSEKKKKRTTKASVTPLTSKRARARTAEDEHDMGETEEGLTVPDTRFDDDIVMTGLEGDEEPLLDDAVDIDNILSLETPRPDGEAISSDDIDEDPLMASIKSTVLSRITCGAMPPLSSFPHLSQQYNTVHTLLSSTITAGESNSLLLLGPRGSGKSLLLDHSLSDLSKSHPDQFHTVRLNGFVQTDDKLALRSIWRQLGREMAVPDNETEEVSSYADTMASLLSLLSHPEELDPMVTDVDATGTKASKSVVFILDEFDLFTTHPRQTLLYNLFDIAQSRKAPIAVIGCSTRMDVVDCLEKRVKSRFSHRWVHVPGTKTLKTFEETLEASLSVALDDTDAVGVTREDLEVRKKWNEWVKSTFIPSSSVQSLLRQVFYTSKSLPDLLSILYIPLATARLTTAPPSHESIPTSTNPSLLTCLPHLPLLHLTLLITAARLTAIHSLPSVTLPLIYTSYTSLLARSRLARSIGSAGGSFACSGLRQWGKSTCRAAWEDLARWDLIVPVGAREEGGEGSETRMWRVDVGIEEVAWAVKEKLGNVGAGEVLGRWCREA